MKTEQTKTIWDLELHEEIWIKASLTVERVPNGWNYKYYENKVQQFNGDRDWELVQVVFVPYTNTYPIKKRKLI